MIDRPLTTFSGLASGLDTASILKQLVEVERIPVRQLQRKQADLGSMAQRIDKLRGRLNDAIEAARELGDVDNVLAVKASSTDEAVVRVRSNGDGEVGSYAIEVTQLAQAEKTTSDAFAARDQGGLFGTGTLDVTIGGLTTSITVDASDTLDSVAAKLDGIAGVSASVVHDGSGYRLLVASEETGADQAIDFTETGVSLGLSDPANELRAAQDAIFSLDGLQMTRSSNSVSDVVAGVTLDLVGTSAPGSAATVTVERDVEAVTGAVRAFVDAFNEVHNAVDAEFVFQGEGYVGNSLSGDATLRRLQRTLQSVVLDSVSGADPAMDRLRTLGIEMGKDGSLSLDERKLADALRDRPNDVATLLAGDQGAGVQGFADRFEERLDPFARSGDGFLAQRAEGFRDRIDVLGDQIDRMELRIDKFEENLRAQFLALEDVMSSLQAQGQQLVAMLGGLPAAGR